MQKHKKTDFYRNGLENCASYPKYPYYWLKATVKSILLDPVYTGKNVALRYTNKSYKNKKKIERPEDEWVVTDKVKEKNSLIKEQDKAKKRIGELDTLLQKIYENMVFGVISKERYMSMSENMEKELSALKARSNEISAALQENDNNRTNAEKFAELIENYIGITELDYELVHTLIEKIYIHERENIGGKAVVKVDIYYRFIGSNADSDNPTEISRRRS